MKGSNSFFEIKDYKLEEGSDKDGWIPVFLC